MEDLFNLKEEYTLEAYQYFNDNIREIPRDENGGFDINPSTAHNNDVDVKLEQIMPKWQLEVTKIFSLTLLALTSASMDFLNGSVMLSL